MSHVTESHGCTTPALAPCWTLIIASGLVEENIFFLSSGWHSSDTPFVLPSDCLCHALALTELPVLLLDFNHSPHPCSGWCLRVHVTAAWMIRWFSLEWTYSDYMFTALQPVLAFTLSSWAICVEKKPLLETARVCRQCWHSTHTQSLAVFALFFICLLICFGGSISCPWGEWLHNALSLSPDWQTASPTVWQWTVGIALWEEVESTPGQLHTRTLWKLCAVLFSRSLHRRVFSPPRQFVLLFYILPSPWSRQKYLCLLCFVSFLGLCGCEGQAASRLLSMLYFHLRYYFYLFFYFCHR